MERFKETVASITEVGLAHHGATILENSRANIPAMREDYTLREVFPHRVPAIIVRAGPSVYRQKTLKRIAESNFDGCIVAVDAAYIQCLKAEILPDFVVTIDPHPTRIVRWFGDPDYSENSKHDDYFKRQDLDTAFRENSAAQNRANIGLVDENRVPLVICSAAPENVVARTHGFMRYWFAPLVDNPAQAGLTRQIFEATGLPALNTGGTVGTAAWAFAYYVLQASSIAVVGMDLGYYMDTPFKNTQQWHNFGDDPQMYPHFHGPFGTAYTDPTYSWYRQNFLDLLAANNARIVNCSEHGLLFGEGVHCMKLGEWLAHKEREKWQKSFSSTR